MREVAVSAGLTVLVNAQLRFLWLIVRSIVSTHNGLVFLGKSPLETPRIDGVHIRRFPTSIFPGKKRPVVFMVLMGNDCLIMLNDC